jgi:hypothetical protein
LAEFRLNHRINQSAYDDFPVPKYHLTKVRNDRDPLIGFHHLDLSVEHVDGRNFGWHGSGMRELFIRVSPG